MSAKALVANLQACIRVPHPLAMPLALLNRHSWILEEEVRVPARRDVWVEQPVLPPVNEAADLAPLGVEQRQAIGTAARLARVAFAFHVAAGEPVGSGTLIIAYLVAAEAFLPKLDAGVVVAARLAQALALVLRHDSVKLRRRSVGKSAGKHVVGITAAGPRHTQPSGVSGWFEIPHIDAIHAAAELGSITRAWDVALQLGRRADWGRVEAVIAPALDARFHSGQIVARSCAGLLALVVCETDGIVIKTLCQNARTGAALKLPGIAAQSIPTDRHGTWESCGGCDD